MEIHTYITIQDGPLVPELMEERVGEFGFPDFRVNNFGKRDKVMIETFSKVFQLCSIIYK